MRVDQFAGSTRIIVGPRTEEVLFRISAVYAELFHQSCYRGSVRRCAIHVGGAFQSVMEGFVDIELPIPP
jgi:hypothetical protein